MTELDVLSNIYTILGNIYSLLTSQLMPIINTLSILVMVLIALKIVVNMWRF